MSPALNRALRERVQCRSLSERLREYADRLAERHPTLATQEETDLRLAARIIARLEMAVRTED